MLLSEIIDDPIGSLNYLERYINDGSPSGFTQKYRPSEETDPFKGNPSFKLAIYTSESNLFKEFGFVPDFIENQQASMLLHPDTVNSLNIDRPSLNQTAFEVVPTASGRTVRVVGGKHCIKLHYEGVLGRVFRGLPYKKAVAGPEISIEIKSELDTFPERFAFFDEIGAKTVDIVVDNVKINEIGMVVRDMQPFGHNANKIKYVIPYFSLFSLDKNANKHEILFLQLLQAINEDPFEYSFTAIFKPILDSYFHLIAAFGYIPELNAQNLLIGVGEDNRIVSVIFRDLQRFEKDIDMRKSLGRDISFESFPYKTIDSNDPLYIIRHSFSYDFKLSRYVLEPIVDILSNKFFLDKDAIIDKISHYANEKITLLPNGYFPHNEWYRHDDILLTKKRPYVKESNPQYRF